MNKLKKYKRWAIKLFVLTAIIAVLVSFMPNLPTHWSLANITNWFVSQPTAVWSFDLNGGEWSGWITTPVKTDYRIDSKVPVEICFIDDPECRNTFMIYPENYRNPTWFGIRRGIFKILSPVDSTVIVTIEER